MKKLSITLMGLLSILTMNAQVKIGNNSTVVNTNSVLELESAAKGLLLPRVALISTTAFTPLTGHIAGMTVYNTSTAGTAPTNVTPGLYYNDGTKWARSLGQNNIFTYYDWLKTGNLQTTATGDNSVNIYHTAGNVGIGTATPTAVLDVRGDGSNFKPILSLMNTNVAGNPTLNVYPGYFSNGVSLVSGNQYSVVFDQDPGTTGPPTQALYDFHGQLRSALFTTLSDRRLKENISDMNQYGLKEALAIHSRNYTLKEYQTKDIGLIAQELQQIVPELVLGQETENTLLSVDYSKLSLILINAIKEQQAQIETIKAANAVLNTKISTVNGLNKELNTLKATVQKLIGEVATN